MLDGFSNGKQTKQGIVKAKARLVAKGFKQKTAYEILSGLVGSEMCIRDRQELSL